MDLVHSEGVEMQPDFWNNHYLKINYISKWLLRIFHLAVLYDALVKGLISCFFFK